MKRWACLFVFLLGPVLARAQNTTTLSGSGAPSGGCAFVLHYVDVLNNKSYDCNNSGWFLIGPGAAGSAAFSSLTSGTNTGQTLTVGNGSVLAPSGTGVVNANQCNGGTCGTLTGNQTITLSGDATGSGATAITVTNVNLPDGVTQAGSILVTDIAAPTAPGAAHLKLFGDSTDLRFHDKNAAGTIGTTVVSDTGASNNFLTAVSAAGVISKSRPACANLSDASAFCNGTSYSSLTGVPSTFAPSAHNLLSAQHGDTVAHTVVLGDLIVGNSTPAWAALAGQTSATKNFLTQTGNGSVSALPAWGTIANGDLPGSGAATVSGQTCTLGSTCTITRECSDGLGDGLNAIAAGTYVVTNCFNDFGATYTITAIRCFTDNNGTSTLNAANDAATGLLTGAVTCTNAFASGTQSGTTTIATSHWINFTFVSDGATKRATFEVTVTR